ncbi:MAG: hypothetical protein K2Y30_15990 [Flavobacteriaceae bacterium]|nr:hypothetical protein [Flavobacteriaceae bacterium]
MGYNNITSKEHFTAYEQVITDYKLIVVCEMDLATYQSNSKNIASKMLKKEIISRLERIISNKNILNENTKADQEYLNRLLNE